MMRISLPKSIIAESHRSLEISGTANDGMLWNPPVILPAVSNVQNKKGVTRTPG